MERISLVYDVERECPGREDFLEAVSARTARARFGEFEGASRTFVVHAGKGESAWRGSLLIHTMTAADSTRDVSGESCKVVIDALALFTALAVDPMTSGRDLPRATPLSAKNPGATTHATAPSPEERVVTKPPPPHVSWGVFLGSGAAAVAGIVPAASLLSAAPFVEIRRFSERLFAPAASLGLRVAEGRNQTADGGFFVQWVAAEAAFCILRYEVFPALTLRTCATVEGGRLGVAPFGVALPLEQSSPWLAAGGVARIETTLYKRLSLFIAGGPVFAIERERFYFQPSDLTAEQASLVGGRLTLEVAVRLF